MTKQYTSLLDWVYENYTLDEWPSELRSVYYDGKHVIFTANSPQELWVPAEDLSLCTGQTVTWKEWATGKLDWFKKQQKEKSMNKRFTKSDLKTGMIIKQRCGEIAMVLLDTANGDIYSGETWGPMSNYSDDLTSLYAKRSDIIAVYQPRSNCSFLSYGLSVEDHAVLWEEPKAPTEQEILMQKIAEHEKSLAELKQQASKLQEK